MKYLLECEMATYERLRATKRTPKSELRRHESIIRKAFAGSYSTVTPRVDDVLSGETDLDTYFIKGGADG